MKRLLCIFFALTLLFTFASCGKGNGDGKETSTATTSSAQSEGGSSTGAGTTGSSSATKAPNDPSGGTTKNSTGETTLVHPGTLPEGSVINIPTGSDGMPEDTQFKGTLAELIKGGKYTLEFDALTEFEGQVLKLPVKTVISGNKTYIETSMPLNMVMGESAGQQKVIFIATGKNNYVLLPKMNLGVVTGNYYLNLPEEEFGSMLPDGLDPGGKDITYVKTTKVRDNGVDYICEEYKTGSGRVKYYFNDGSLKIIEVIDRDGVSRINVKSFSAKADDSLFTLPKGYTDISKLLGV